MNTPHPTRTKIIEAALALLGRAGPAGFSASALAREAGVSKATLFHHFATLDEVPQAALEALLLALMEGPEVAGLGLRGYLEALGAGVVALSTARREFLSAYFVFFTRALFDEPMRAQLEASIERLHVSMHSELRARMPAATTPAAAATTAHLVELALDGLGLHLLLRDTAALERAWQRLVDLIMHEYQEAL